MADRRQLLDRLRIALANPDVDGVLASPDIMDDLLLLGALEGKLLFGSMNRGGLAGAGERDSMTALPATPRPRSRPWALTAARC